MQGFILLIYNSFLHMPRIVELLIEHGADVNIACDSGATVLLYACYSDTYSICKILIENGADPNIIDENTGRTTLYCAVDNDNLNIMKLLIENNKKPFDFAKLTNKYDVLDDSGGYNAFLQACSHGHTDIIEYMIKIALQLKNHKYNNNHSLCLDLESKDKTGSNALLIACNFHQNVNFIEYLINDVFVKHVPKYKHINNNNNDNIDSLVQSKTRKKQNCLMYEAANGNLPVVKLFIEKYKCDINVTDNENNTLLHLCATNDHWQCAQYLVSIKEYNPNTVNKSQETPVMLAIQICYLKLCEIMCKDERVDITNFKNELGKDCLELAAFAGKTHILPLLFATTIKREKIKNWDGLEKCDKIFNNKMSEKLINAAKTRAFEGTVDLLQRVYKNAFLAKNFLLLEMILDYGNDGTNIAKTLIEYCDKAKIGQALANVVNEMIVNRDCVNDSLLLYAKLYDSQQTMKNIHTTMHDVLKASGSDGKNEKKQQDDNSEKEEKNERGYAWFKECILTSDMFGLPNNEEKSQLKEKEKEEKENNDHNNNNKVKLLFDDVVTTVIDKELVKQQLHIKDELKKLETEKESNGWKELRLIENEMFVEQGTQQQNVLLLPDPLLGENQKGEHGVQLKYNHSHLIKDVLTGFDAKSAYDNNIIGTELCIFANRSNSVFQHDCKNVFDNICNKAGINNKNYAFKNAQIKTLDRLQAKAANDYFDRNWPHTCHVIDLARCSIVLDISQDFVTVYTQFKTKLNSYGDISEVLVNADNAGGVDGVGGDYDELGMTNNGQSAMVI